MLTLEAVSNTVLRRCFTPLPLDREAECWQPLGAGRAGQTSAPSRRAETLNGFGQKKGCCGQDSPHRHPGTDSLLKITSSFSLYHRRLLGFVQTWDQESRLSSSAPQAEPWMYQLLLCFLL